MAIVLLRVNVAYPDECLKTLKDNEPHLKRAGFRACTTAPLAKVANVLYIMLTWSSADAANQFWASASGRNLINSLGSVETTEVVILEDAKELE